MKKINFLSLILAFLLTILAFSNAFGQEPVEDVNKNPRRAGRPFRIMKELGLTGEQIQQIRRINQTRRPIMQDAQQRWQIARRELDAAIYADEANEEEIKELTKTAMLAQAELLKERTLTEFLIRKVLTPEQLTKFRDLRRQLLQRPNNRKNARIEDVSSDEPNSAPNRFEQPRRRGRGQ